MRDAKSCQTEEIRCHKIEMQRESDEAASNDCFLVFFSDWLAYEWLESFLNLLALKKPCPDEILLDCSVSDEGDDYPIGG